MTNALTIPATQNQPPESNTSSLRHDVAAAARALAGARRIWVGTHIDPDGDAIGSMLGLAAVLEDAGHQVTMACQEEPPPEVAFLPGLERIGRQAPGGHDLAVAIDCGALGRLGDLVDPATWQRMATIVIDHHLSNTRFGAINVVDPTVASASEIVLTLADEMVAPISPAAAMSLLTGIVTDTIGFRTSNTRPETLDRARRLMAQGGSLATITQGVFYTRPVAVLQLLSRAIARLVVDGPFAVTTLRLADLEELGLTSAAMRGVTEQLSTAREPLVIGLLREREDGSVDLSLRSKPGIDVIPAARALGGGGHPQAAGARWDSELGDATRAVWAALREHVRIPAGATRA